MSRDPAFLFYDGDAARDVSHMNRLERGAYFDFIQAQRKFGGVTVEQARKIIGKDFDACWPSLEMVLTCVDGLYFVQWIKDSTERREHYSKTQKDRIQRYWDKKNTPVIPRNNHGKSVDLPLEEEIENEIENETEQGKKGSRGGKPNPWFDAVREVFGLIGKTQAPRVGKVSASMREQTPAEVEPVTEIRRRMANYASHMKDCACTPEALAKHWALCEKAKFSTSSTSLAADQEKLMQRKRMAADAQG